MRFVTFAVLVLAYLLSFAWILDLIVLATTGSLPERLERLRRTLFRNR
jgi:hypothetical protein